MATTEDVAKGLAAFTRNGQFAEAIAAYYDDNIVSTEPFGEPATVKGIDAIHGKNKWWQDTFEMHGVEVSGPYINGNQFTVGYKLDATNRQSGERNIMDEVALYTVADGKIVDERFFYGGH